MRSGKALSIWTLWLRKDQFLGLFMKKGFNGPKKCVQTAVWNFLITSLIFLFCFTSNLTFLRCQTVWKQIRNCRPKAEILQPFYSCSTMANLFRVNHTLSRLIVSLSPSFLKQLEVDPLCIFFFLLFVHLIILYKGSKPLG